MVISAHRLGPTLSARATKVAFSPDMMTVYLEDGRRVGVPIVWFPRLVEASEQQRQQWRLIGHGVGIHWEALDEDISVEGLLATRDESLTPLAGDVTAQTTLGQPRDVDETSSAARGRPKRELRATKYLKGRN